MGLDVSETRHDSNQALRAKRGNPACCVLGLSFSEGSAGFAPSFGKRFQVEPVPSFDRPAPSFGLTFHPG